MDRQGAVRLLLLSILVGGMSACSAPAGSAVSSDSASPAATPTASAATAPTGVPAAVYEAARGCLDQPSNRLTMPVEWIETTYGAWVKIGDPANPPPTNGRARVKVYVVQCRGVFVNAFSHTMPSGTASGPRPPLTVLGSIIPIGPHIPGVYVTSGYGGIHPMNLAKIAPVHTFELS